MNYSKIFEDSFLASPDCILICNQEGLILRANNSVVQVFNYEINEIIGEQLEMLLPDSIKKKHKIYFKDYIKAPESRPMSTKMRLQGKKKNGDLTYLSISLTSGFDENNELFIIAVIRDINEIVHKTNYLEKLGQEHKEALQISKLGHWEFERLNEKLTWSEEVFDIFELSPEEFTPTQKGFLNLVHPDDREYCEKSFEDSINSEIPYNIVHRYVTPKGDLKFFRERGSNYYDDNKQFIKTKGTVQDITEFQNQKILLNNYIEKLEFKNKELEEFTNITAHDLQEPLTNIIGLIELLKMEWGENNSNKEELTNYINFIGEGAKRMSKLIKGLMETSRLGKSSQLEVVDCNIILEEVKMNLYSQIQKYDARIFSRDLPKVRGHMFELSLLFQNLISNALKYSRKGVPPFIEISFHDQGNSWVFKFEDNGIGIKPNDKDKLFKMFRRLHLQSDVEGTGVGLAQCKKIVELHQGEIWFESEFGKGTAFMFTLRK